MIFYRVQICQNPSSIYFDSEIEAKKYIINKEIDYLESVIKHLLNMDLNVFILKYKEYIDYYNELYTLINKNKINEAYSVLYKYKHLNYVEDNYLTKCQTREATEINFLKKVQNMIMKANKIMVFK